MNLAQPSTGDEAENSIMQTISIAVSAILIAAGLVTAPSLINNARDVNAQGDLANVAYAQEAANADAGHYFQNINHDEPSSLADYRGADGRLIKFTTSGDVYTVGIVCGAGSDSTYVLKAISASGHTFYRTSASPRILATPPSYADTGLNGCSVPVTQARYDVFTRITKQTPVMLESYLSEANADGTTPGTDPKVTAEPGDLTLVTGTLPEGTYGEAYSAKLTASRSATFAVTGTLPPGITLDGDTLSGKPTTGGTYTFTVTATSGSETVSRDLTIKVTKVDLAISTTTLPDGNLGTAYSVDLDSNRKGTTFAVSSGTLPAGLTLKANGTLSGTPTGGGKSTFTVKATEGTDTATRSLSLTVTYTQVAGWKGSSPTGGAIVGGTAMASTDGSRILVTGSDGKVYVSNNGGDSYTDVTPAGVTGNYIGALSGNGEIMMVGTLSGDLYRTGTANATQTGWTKSSQKIGGSGFMKMDQVGNVVVSNNAGNVYSICATTTPNGCSQTANWRSLSVVPTVNSFDLTSLGGTTPYMIWGTTTGRYTEYKAIDASTSKTGTGAIQVAINDDGTERYIADSLGNIYLNTGTYGAPNATNWKLQGKVSSAWSQIEVTANGSLVGLRDGKVYKSSDKGVTWTEWSPVSGITSISVTQGGNTVTAINGTYASPGVVFVGTVS